MLLRSSIYIQGDLKHDKLHFENLRPLKSCKAQNLTVICCFSWGPCWMTSELCKAACCKSGTSFFAFLILTGLCILLFALWNFLSCPSLLCWHYLRSTFLLYWTSNSKLRDSRWTFQVVDWLYKSASFPWTVRCTCIERVRESERQTERDRERLKKRERENSVLIIQWITAIFKAVARTLHLASKENTDHFLMIGEFQFSSGTLWT